MIEDITEEKEEKEIEKEKGEEEMKESEQIDEPSVEMPIRVKKEVMDSTPITPLPSISFLSSLTPDTTSLDSWGEENLIKISFLAMEKEKEKKVMRNPLFVESVDILNNLLPSNKKVSKVHSVDDVSTILSNFKTNFSSLKESTSVVAEEKYMKNRLSELVTNFALDLSSLNIGQASLKEFSTKGRKIIANCMNQDKLTTNLYKKFQEAEAMIENVRKSVEDPSTNVNMCNNVYQG